MTFEEWDNLQPKDQVIGVRGRFAGTLEVLAGLHPCYAQGFNGELAVEFRVITNFTNGYSPYAVGSTIVCINRGAWAPCLDVVKHRETVVKVEPSTKRTDRLSLIEE